MLDLNMWIDTGRSTSNTRFCYPNSSSQLPDWITERSWIYDFPRYEYITYWVTLDLRTWIDIERSTSSSRLCGAVVFSLLLLLHGLPSLAALFFLRGFGSAMELENSRAHFTPVASSWRKKRDRFSEYEEDFDWGLLLYFWAWNFGDRDRDRDTERQRKRERRREKKKKDQQCGAKVKETR